MTEPARSLGAVTAIAAGARVAERYQLERRIAVGGMGEVWEAEDVRLGRSVAVKVLRPELSGDPEFLHRFRVEARTVASLDHSGIAAVFDYGEDDGAHTAYLVMELVRGEPLSSLIARGPLEPEQTLRIMEQSARALQAVREVCLRTARVRLRSKTGVPPSGLPHCGGSNASGRWSGSGSRAPSRRRRGGVPPLGPRTPG